LSALKEGDPFDTEKLSLNGIESAVFGHFADLFFDLRKEAKRGAVPKAPWLGLELEAALKDTQWSGIAGMRDYGPDWVARLQPKEETPAQTSELSDIPALPEHWQEAWAQQRSQRASQTPWLKTQHPLDRSEENPVGPSETVPHERSSKPDDQEPEEKKDETLSAAETGLRFHALMEHSTPVASSQGDKFIERLLRKATTREHELEMWGCFSTAADDPTNGKRGLFRTQRRIIDLFCVIPTSAWPQKLWNAPCVPTGDATPLSVQSLLQEALAAERTMNLVVDFKTGAPKAEHLEQMRTYLRWVKHILAKQPHLLVNQTAAPTLFSPSDKALLGILYYTSANNAAQDNLFASCLISVDKNASVLFVSPE
jgi:hypothetical protein